MSKIPIWVMEQELCDACGALLSYFGECPECGHDPFPDDEDYGWEEDEDEEELSTEEELYFLQEYYHYQEEEASSPSGQEDAKVQG